MHGRLFDLLCTSCDHMEPNFDSPVCPALSGTERLFAADDQQLEPNIPVGDLPRCPKCNALARPGVVWFGENLYEPEERIQEIVDEANLCLVVGTSSTVSTFRIHSTYTSYSPGRCSPPLAMLKMSGKMAARLLYSTWNRQMVMIWQILCFLDHARSCCRKP